MELFPYQAIGADWLAARQSALLADEMGLGKTPQAIVAAHLTGAKHVTVVCPAIARTNWEREVRKWGSEFWSIAAPLTGAALRKAAVRATSVLIVSYTALASEPVRALLETRHSDVLILDEAHYLKNPKAVRSRAVYGHRFDRRKGLAANSGAVWLLSGTIMPNNPSEIWTHARALGWTDMRFQQWIGAYCTTYNDGFSEKITGARNTAGLARLLRPHVLRRRVADVLTDLPPLRWGTVSVRPERMPAAHDDQTAEERAVLAQARERLARGEDVDDLAMHLASLRRWTGIAKAPAVVELLSEEHERTVIFAIHRSVIDVLAQGLGAAVIEGATNVADRQRIIDDFQAGRGPRVLVCQLSVASTALTLTAASNVVFAETSWTPADLLQAAKRCHRIGQKLPVLARIISLAGSVDEDVSDALVRKVKFVNAMDVALAA